MRTTFPFSSFAVKGLELIHPVAPDRLYNGELPTMLCVSCALAAVPTIPQLNTPAMAPRIDRRPSFQREPARIDSISFHRQLYTPESRLRFASSLPNGQPLVHISICGGALPISGGTNPATPPRSILIS